jgi:hypothetical protein
MNPEQLFGEEKKPPKKVRIWDSIDRVWVDAETSIKYDEATASFLIGDDRYFAFHVSDIIDVNGHYLCEGSIVKCVYACHFEEHKTLGMVYLDDYRGWILDFPHMGFTLPVTDFVDNIEVVGHEMTDCNLIDELVMDVVEQTGEFPKKGT